MYPLPACHVEPLRAPREIIAAVTGLLAAETVTCAGETVTLARLLEPARAFAVVGTPEQCAEQLRAVLDLGFQGVSCNLAAVSRPSMYAGLAETVAGAARAIAALR